MSSNLFANASAASPSSGVSTNMTCRFNAACATRNGSRKASICERFSASRTTSTFTSEVARIFPSAAEPKRTIERREEPKALFAASTKRPRASETGPASCGSCMGVSNVALRRQWSGAHFSRCFCTLPSAVRGIEFTFTNRRGTLKDASCSRQTRARHVSPDLVIHSDDRRLGNPLLFEEQLFDLARIDVEAGADDQIALPPEQRVVAVSRNHSHVAGADVAIRGERRIAAAPVAGEERRRLHQQLAILDADRHARQRKADGSSAALADIGIADRHERLRHPVPLEDRLAEERTKSLQHMRRQR